MGARKVPKEIWIGKARKRFLERIDSARKNEGGQGLDELLRGCDVLSDVLSEGGEFRDESTAMRYLQQQIIDPLDLARMYARIRKETDGPYVGIVVKKESSLAKLIPSEEKEVHYHRTPVEPAKGIIRKPSDAETFSYVVLVQRRMPAQ